MIRFRKWLITYVNVLHFMHCLSAITPHGALLDCLANALDGQHINTRIDRGGFVGGMQGREGGVWMLVTGQEMEDSIRHAISQPGTPAWRIGQGHPSLCITLSRKDIKPLG